jgi:hypothetical protein
VTKPVFKDYPWDPKTKAVVDGPWLWLEFDCNLIWIYDYGFGIQIMSYPTYPSFKFRQILINITISIQSLGF